MEIPAIKTISGNTKASESQYKIDMAEVNLRLISLEEEKKRLKSSLADLHKNNRLYKASVNGHGVDIAKIQDELSNIRLELAKPSNVECTTEQTALSNAVEEIRSELEAQKSQQDTAREHLNGIVAELQKMPPLSQTHQNVEAHPEQPTRATKGRFNPEDYVFDAEIIFVHDSNGSKVKADILKHNASAQKALAYTIPDAIEIMSKATFSSQPRFIYLHLITNDLESAKPSDIREKFRELLRIIRARCPDAEIYFSSVLARLNYMNRVEHMNDFLRSISETNCYLVDHGNISSDMLRDRKHFNKTGFSFF